MLEPCLLQPCFQVAGWGIWRAPLLRREKGELHIIINSNSNNNHNSNSDSNSNSKLIARADHFLVANGAIVCEMSSIVVHPKPETRNPKPESLRALLSRREKGEPESEVE